MVSREWLSARLWVPIFALAAIVLAPPGATLNSVYAARWLAAGLVLLAAIGRKRRWAGVAAIVLSTAGALYIAAENVILVAGGGTPVHLLFVAGALLVILPARRIFTAEADPLLIVSVQLAYGIGIQWLYYQVSGLAFDSHAFGKESLQALAGTELSLLALAFAGVGLGVWRTWRPAIERLGWTAPTWWHVALALLVAQVFSLSSIPANLLTYLMMPKAFAAISATSQHVFGGLPWWTFPAFAVMAAIGEETLFRGALQPRFGIVVAAALFAMLHLQYGTTPIFVMVFLHGLGYGLLRRHLNTTTAAIAHATYDFGAYIRMSYASHFVLALILAVLLAEPAWRHRRLIWRTVSEAFRDDWRGLTALRA